jgi:NADH-quinone oxidoreductase subunit M
MLWMAKRVIFGKTSNSTVSTLKDINYLEGSVLIILCLVSLVFGFYPEPLLNTMDVSVNGIIENHQNELAINLINKK